MNNEFDLCHWDTDDESAASPSATVERAPKIITLLLLQLCACLTNVPFDFSAVDISGRSVKYLRMKVKGIQRKRALFDAWAEKARGMLPGRMASEMELEEDNLENNAILCSNLLWIYYQYVLRQD